MNIKRTLISFIIIGAPGLAILPSHAQGNLLENTSWTVQPGPIGGIIYTNSSPADGIFPVIFTFGGGTISQTIATAPGAEYDLSFQAIQYDGINNSSVSINGSLLANFSPDDPFISPVDDYGNQNFQENTVWETFDFDFTASSANTVVVFTEFGEDYGGSDSDVFSSHGGLDDISVTSAPEPSSLALLGIALAGWRAIGARGGKR